MCYFYSFQALSPSFFFFFSSCMAEQSNPRHGGAQPHGAARACLRWALLQRSQKIQDEKAHLHFYLYRLMLATEYTWNKQHFK